MELSDFSGRELPYSLEAEQTVLGAMLIDSEVLPLVTAHLKSESFYVKKHQELFGVIIRLFTLGVEADIITVLNEAVRDGVFENSSGGKEYLAKLMNEVPAVSNVESYCKIVEEKYYIRSLITASKEIAEAAADGQESAETLLDFAEQKIYDIRQGKEVDGLVRIGDVIMDTFDRLGKISGPDKEQYLGAKSGFVGLDSIITGLNKSDLILLAARPGMGKTSFALNVVTNVCRFSQGREVAVFSLEMSKDQLVSRMLSAEAMVNSNSLLTGKLDSNDWTNIASGADRLAQMPIYLDDTAGITVVQMKAKLRRLKNLGLVVIDYLQLMNSGRRIDNRVNEVSEITRQLKLMAKELNVPVITLSQLSRAVESRTDHRPMLSDLRESGSIEQDADIVLFLYREGYYNKKATDLTVSECIVAKNRHGETGTVNLRWDGQYTKFSSIETRGYDEP